MKPFQKIVAPTVQELFMQEMMSALLSGDLKPGDRLPTERTLAEQMGVSKTVVHNGFKEMQHLGFVEIKPQNGVYVSDYMKNGNLETFLSIARYGNGEFNYELAQCFTDVLLTIDNMAFQLFVEKPENKSAAIQQLNRRVDQIGIALTDPKRSLAEKADALEQIHYDFSEFSGSPALTFMLNSMKPTSNAIFENYIQVIRPEDIINSTDNIVRALEHDNAQKAFNVLAKTIHEYLEQIKD